MFVNQCTEATALVQSWQEQEASLSLMDETCRSRFWLQPNPTNKVCVFFHGFTATPAQFDAIGQTFFDAGYHVLIPLLPGHGLAGDWSSHNPPPLPEDPETYKDFGLYWLEQAQQLGEKVIVGGLSGGSTLAAWLALERPESIDRALLFAPYLSNSNFAVDWLVRLLNIYFEWKVAPGADHFGYDGFYMPALRLFLDMGQEILHRAKQDPAAPMLIVSSECDGAVSSHDHQALFESIVKNQPKAWYYCFDDDLNVPHNMMTEGEGNKCVDLLLAIAKSYAESDLTWDELEQLRDRIAGGMSFEEAIGALGLEGRASEDLLPLVTLAE